ncbi:MAG: TetR family transcriptional regulator [Tetrasphaera sp.]
MTRTTLRERKKAERRELLSAVATDLFFERGFDAVTIADIAESADVGKMTVWNYFPRKEDLLFDRFAEQIDLVTKALARREGRRVSDVIRDHELELIEAASPLAGIGARVGRFWEVVAESAVLTTRWHAHFRELAGLLGQAYGASLSLSQADLAASLVAATMEHVQRLPLQLQLGAPTEVAEQQETRRRIVTEAFDRLEAGLAALCV